MLNLGTSSSSCRDCCMCLCDTAKCQDPVSDESSFKLNSNYPVNLLSLLTPAIGPSWETMFQTYARS